MKAGQTYWGHAESEEAEGWSGAYDTREQAVDAGRNEHDGDFWVSGGPAITTTIDADEITEIIEERARDEAIWSDEPIVIDDPGKTLQALLDAWIAEHVQPQVWTSDSSEKVDAE